MYKHKHIHVHVHMQENLAMASQETQPAARDETCIFVTPKKDYQIMNEGYRYILYLYACTVHVYTEMTG